MSKSQTQDARMLRTRCAAMIVVIVTSLAVAASARATPAPPAIAIQQQGGLTMSLSASTGTAWSWTIVDASGAVVTAATGNPIAPSFGAAGDYKVLLDATDDDPLAPEPAHAEATFHVYAAPVAAFTYAQLPDGTVQVTDTSSGDPTAWTWTFPTGTYTGRVPPPQALPAGTSTVSLEVGNPAGDSLVTASVVVNGPPQAVLSILSSPAAVDAPVLLDAGRSTDPNQDALSYSWDLNGDGQFGDATGPQQTVSYGARGRYRVAVQVSDGHGGITTADGTITVVSGQAPVVTFANDPLQPNLGVTVVFRATASDPDGSVERIEWDLDDDGAFDDAAGSVATWSFRTAGPHRVAVRATDDRGVASVAFRTIDVVAPPAADPVRVLTAAAGSSPQSSAPGPVIPQSPAPSTTRATLLAPFPVVRIRGLTYRGTVRISLLKVQAPPGAAIRVRCRRGSCSAKRPDLKVTAARKAVRVRSLEGRSLRVGTVVEVFVTAPKHIGKYVRFTVRRNAAPARTDLCLPAGGTKPMTCPTT
jgi:PKD repeat protein